MIAIKVFPFGWTKPLAAEANGNRDATAEPNRVGHKYPARKSSPPPASPVEALDGMPDGRDGERIINMAAPLVDDLNLIFTADHLHVNGMPNELVAG